MDADDLRLFEAERPRLRAAAVRMLGPSSADAEDAVQEAWLRYQRTDRSVLANPAAWLMTVVGRICLDVLRARKSRPEVPASPELLAVVEGGDGSTSGSRSGSSGSGSGSGSAADSADPADEAVLVESVGRALLVVLARLGPAERIAFVLHDLFAVPFDEIAPVVGRTTLTTKKLASRARQRVRGDALDAPVDVAVHRRVVEAFIAAARGRDISGLLAVLDADVVRVADPAALPAGARLSLRGASAVVEETVLLWRNSLHAAVALVDGHVGMVVAPHGRLRSVLKLEIVDGRIRTYEVIAAPDRLARVEIAVLDADGSTVDMEVEMDVDVDVDEDEGAST